jgi:hypothetical protein
MTVQDTVLSCINRESQVCHDRALEVVRGGNGRVADGGIECVADTGRDDLLLVEHLPHDDSACTRCQWLHRDGQPWLLVLATCQVQHWLPSILADPSRACRLACQSLVTRHHWRVIGAAQVQRQRSTRCVCCDTERAGDWTSIELWWRHGLCTDCRLHSQLTACAIAQYRRGVSASMYAATPDDELDDDELDDDGLDDGHDKHIALQIVIHQHGCSLLSIGESKDHQEQHPNTTVPELVLSRFCRHHTSGTPKCR